MNRIKPQQTALIENTLVLFPEYYVNRTFTNFTPFIPVDSDYIGEKFTLIGGTVDDAIWLLERVGVFMLRIGVGFKVATRRQVESQNPEQRIKLMTIYLSRAVDKALLLDDLKWLLRDYTGHQGLSLAFSQPLGGAIYTRTDTDPHGDYMPAGE